MTDVRPTQGPRLLLRRLRETMSSEGRAHERLNKAVGVIAANMVAEVCSVYVLNGGGLELFATEGLNPSAVHQTRLKIGEGLIGKIAELTMPVALSDAQSDPNFAYRAETGEEQYRSLMGVPILRASRVCGVLAVQNRTERYYSGEEVEAMQTVAMVLAEMVDALLDETPTLLPQRSVLMPARLAGLRLNQGLARGTAVLHQPRVVVEKHVADDVVAEIRRIDTGISDLRAEVDMLLGRSGADIGGESREVLEAYRMFAHDRGWLERLHEAVRSGLTAEAAVEREQVRNRTRMQQAEDPYLRERAHDLEDLSNRMLRHLTGRAASAAEDELPENAIVVARNMGPAELLDYDPQRLAGLALEEGGPTSHVAIVARALQIPVVGRVEDLLEQVEPGDLVYIDGDNSLVFLRPGQDVQEQLNESLTLQQAALARYAALKDKPAVTRDGVTVSLSINAGLLADLNHLEATAAVGVGLYRTELHFMMRAALPTVGQQTEFYRHVLDKSGGRPVMFRTLDVGGDKMLPYMRRWEEQNPAMGWRAIRLSLDRPGLLRMQLRALLRAAAGRDLNVMFPMIADVLEFQQARSLFDREVTRMRKNGVDFPRTIRLGTMLEVPSLVWQLPALLGLVDFLSIGSNDLIQFLFASDRGNPRVANRYDILSPASLNVIRQIVQACDTAGVPVSLCGEAAGRPIEAMALLGLGLRNISMSAASIGPVKTMVRALDLHELKTFMATLYEAEDGSVRERLLQFAAERDIPV